jgi:sulfur carrier protein
MDIRIKVNGSEEALASEAAGETVLDLLRRRGLDPGARGLAVAVNGAVVARRRWESARLAAGDDVEIVRPFTGG